MKTWFKAIIFCAVAITVMLLATACSDPTGYEIMNEEGYTVSVKFDANGGAFTTGVTIMVDSYNPSAISKEDADGNKLISLLDPNDEQRGTSARYNPTNSGHFLVGWYKTRTEVTDAEGNLLDADGNPVSESGKPQAYTYSDRWDFTSDQLKIDPDENYSAHDPVMTLYAAWLPLFTTELYSVQTGELLASYTFDPTSSGGTDIHLPTWDTKGTVEYNSFRAALTTSTYVKNNTFNKAYLDKEMSLPIDSDVIAHCGQLNLQNATATDSVMKIYADFLEGKWFKVSTPEQFKQYANADNNLFIENDLDFSENSDNWSKTYLPTYNFNGSIIGKGHTISGITVTQTSLRDTYGLFASLSDRAVIENLTFDNITVIIKSGAHPTKGIAQYGILAGKIASGATVNNVAITNSKLVISPDFTHAGDYSFGLICGFCSNEDALDVSVSNLTCEALELENAEHILQITVEGTSVDVVQSLK